MNFKKTLLSTLIFTTVCGICSGDAFAMDKKTQPSSYEDTAVYVALRGGLDMMRHHGSKNTWLGSGAVGVRMMDMRAELEYTYHGELKKARSGFETKLRSQSYLANLYYDLPLSTHFKPFISAGAGMSHLRSTVAGTKDRQNKFSWTAGGGMAFDITENWALDVGYRYLDLGDSAHSNEFYGGIRMSF